MRLKEEEDGEIMHKKRRNVSESGYTEDLKGGRYDWKYWKMEIEEIYCWIADMVT